MEQEAINHCSECRQPILSGQDFARFKVPGKESYEFFHCRLRAGDCWEARLKLHK